MPLDRTPAKIRSQSDLNQLLINFFDPILAGRSIFARISIRNPNHYIESNSILIKKWSNLIDKWSHLIKIGRK